MADAAERRLREGELFELRSDEAAAVGAFSLDDAGTEGVDPDLLRAELAGQHDGDGVDRGLSAGVNRAVRRCDATATEPMLMMQPPSPRYFTAACVTRRRPSTLMLKCR